jgi:hypothetical protein
MGAPVLQWHDPLRRLKVGPIGAMATAKEAQHDAAESLFGAIIAVLDKHEAEHTLTPEILERHLLTPMRRRLPAASRTNRA